MKQKAAAACLLSKSPQDWQRDARDHAATGVGNVKP
jgi:hypothetical protein